MKKFVTPVLLLFATLISGCASLPNAMTDQVDKRRVEYALTRNGNQTVIFESGLGGTMDWWAKVFPEISKNTSAFAYNRPGYGKSDPVSTPRDGMHIVDELRRLLKSKNLNPPYVLVGHSLGGLYMQLFARRYPDEISALVLVDSTHPEQLKGAGSSENWPVWLRIVFGVATSAVAKEEFNAINVTGECVLRLASFTGKPVLVLSALQPMNLKTAVDHMNPVRPEPVEGLNGIYVTHPTGECEETRSCFDWAQHERVSSRPTDFFRMKEKSTLADDANEKRKDIARLYPGSKQIWVDSGHGIPLENPEAIISAIRDVLPQ